MKRLPLSSVEQFSFEPELRRRQFVHLQSVGARCPEADRRFRDLGWEPEREEAVRRESMSNRAVGPSFTMARLRLQGHRHDRYLEASVFDRLVDGDLA